MFTSHLENFLHKHGLAIFIVLTAVTVLIPPLAIGLLIADTIFTLLIIGAQLSSAILSQDQTKGLHSPSRLNAPQPFVSVHLACHNEPTKIMKKTLQALSDLNYDNYEVLVIDNNTTDKKLWKPIEEFCEKLGPKFRFFHIENLKGFKAGALNFALRHMNPRAEILALVDADYVVDKNFLHESTPFFQDPSVALVQYPQDYSNINQENQGISHEYQSFFSSLLSKANNWNAVTVTGTLGLLRAKLFREDLKWNEWCITEDTELGIHLYSLGYRGIFLNHSRGWGLMPLDYYSLRRQRERWTFGNMQVILKNFLPTIRNPRFTWSQKWGFLSQLTSWFNPNLIPTILLASSLIVTSVVPQPLLFIVSLMSLATILVFFLAKIIYFAVSLYKASSFSWSKLWLTLFAHYGLTATMSTAWLQAIFHPRLPYNRTNKNPEESTPTYIPREIFWALALTMSSALALIISSSIGVKIIAVGTIGFGLFLFFAVLSLLQQLSATRRFTKAMFAVK